MSEKARGRWVYVVAPDQTGRLVGKAIPAARMDEATTTGMPMPNFHLATGPENRPLGGIAAAGAHKGFRNGLLRVDPARPRFRTPGAGEAEWCLADVLDEDGQPVPVAPRAVLLAQLARLEEAGVTARAASELEFYLYRDGDGLQPFHPRHADNDPLVTLVAAEFLARLEGDLEDAGLTLDQVQGEGGVGQLELNLAPAAPAEAADRHVIFKHIVKARAQLDKLAVTFMAKPHAAEPGSSGHIHLSLASAEGPILTEGQPPEGIAAAFIAGLCAYAADFMVLFAPYANSYRRFRPGSYTPLSAGWAWQDRTVMVRLMGRGAAARLEFRLPGADICPYHAYAGLIAAGLAGVEAGLNIPPPGPGNIRLPRDLSEAVAAFAASGVARGALGTAVHSHLLSHAQAEREAELNRVPDTDRLRLFDTA